MLSLSAFDAPRAQEVPLGFSWGPEESVQHDDNLTRVNAQSGYPVISDTSYVTDLVGTLNETYGRQKVMASATIGRVLDQNYPQFDVTTQDMYATLQSDLPLATQTLIRLQRTAQLAHFADLGSPIRDVISRNELYATVDFPMTVNWRAVLAGDDSRTQNSAPILQTQNLNATELDAGIRFQPVTGNHVDLLARTLHAAYPNGSPSALISAGYNDRGADLRVDWTLTGASHLLGRVGYVEHRNDEVLYLDTTTFPFQIRTLNRDFSGPAYDLTYIWQLTGASRLTIFGSRQTGAAGDNNYLSAVNRTFRLTPGYQPSPMLGFEAFFEWSLRDYFSNVYAVVTGLPPGTARTDNSHFAGLGMTWNPRHWLQVSLTLRHEQRDSSIAFWTYSDNNAALSVQGRF